jgi:hypothetical protein
MRTLLASLTFLILATLSLLTAQSANAQQAITPATLGAPGTTLLTTFPNGTSKVTWVNGTETQFLNGIGVLILDPSISSAAAAAASSTSVSNTNVVNRIYQAIAVAIGITLPPVPQPPPLNNTPPPVDPIPDPPDPIDDPLPYCDKVADDYTGSCHDRLDFDDVTGLYPCNDGTQEEDWRDCPDATELDEPEEPELIESPCPPGFMLLEEECVIDEMPIVEPPSDVPNQDQADEGTDDENSDELEQGNGNNGDSGDEDENDDNNNNEDQSDNNNGDSGDQPEDEQEDEDED